MVRSVGYPGRVNRVQLGNGLEVILAHDAQSPTVSCWVWYRVGSVHEHPGITGVSHWVEHMLFQGSPHYRKGEIDRAIFAIGGTSNAFTDTDFTAYFATVPREHWETPLRIESDRMVDSRMDPRDSDREREVIQSEREGNENRPEFRVDEELLQLAYRHHPYRWDPLGFAHDMARMPTSAVAEYYHRYYGPSNAVLVLAGGFDPAQARKRIEQLFGRLSGGAPPAPVAVTEPPIHGRRAGTLTGPGSTGLVERAWHAPSFDDPQVAAAIFLDQLLGGETSLFSPHTFWSRPAEHPNSRLYRGLVRAGLAVRVSSDFRPRTYPGLFSVQAQAAPGVPLDRVEEALEEGVRTLRADGPTQREWNDARATIARGARLSYEGSTRSGFRIGFFAANGGLDREGRLLRQVLRLRPQEVQREAARLLSEEACVSVRYTPTGGPADG